MAPNNLYEYYKSTGQALPTVEQRADVASKAGITGYVGSEDQNKTLLGYLTNTPDQNGNNTITSDNLTKENPVVLPTQKTDTAPAGMNATINALASATNKNVETDQKAYDEQAKSLAEAMKVSGDTSAFNEKVIKDQGVDTKKKIVDDFTTQIEQEQKSALDQITQLKSTFQGTTGGLNAEINRIQTASANKLANLGIGLSASTRNYETASNIANRLITANTD